MKVIIERSINHLAVRGLRSKNCPSDSAVQGLSSAKANVASKRIELNFSHVIAVLLKDCGHCAQQLQVLDNAVVTILACHSPVGTRDNKPFRPMRRCSLSSAMASTLLRRQLRRSLPNLSRRWISSTPSFRAEPINESGSSPATGSQGATNVFGTHTVEDLHGMSASEILAETGSRKDISMRHFTGEYMLTPSSVLLCTETS